MMKPSKPQTWVVVETLLILSLIGVEVLGGAEDPKSLIGRPIPMQKIVTEVLKNVELPCPSAQDMPQRIEWYKQNPGGRGRKRITQFPHRYELSNEGSIKINAVTVEDSGTYLCKVANKEPKSLQLVVTGEAGSLNNNQIIKSPKLGNGEDELYSGPEILTSMLPKETVYHVSNGLPNLILRCESSGNPKPTISWYKNDKILSSSTTNVSTLKLRNISQEDNGQYLCESVNLFGVSRYKLNIQVTDNWFGASEILDLSPRNLTVVEGGSVNISCLARFEMKPWFAWVKQVSSNKTAEGSKVFFHAGRSAHFEVLTVNPVVKVRGDNLYSTELVLLNVSKNDSGVYFCAVAGLQGYNLSETSITVEPDPSKSLGYYKPNTMAAQWAILWTISFVFLVMLVVLSFVKLYGCRPSKPDSSSSSSTIKTIKPLLSPQANFHCQLPQGSSPLTMSSQETFVPNVPLGSFVSERTSFESDCDCDSSVSNPFMSPQSNNDRNRPHYIHYHYTSPSSSCISSSVMMNECDLTGHSHGHNHNYNGLTIGSDCYPNRFCQCQYCH